MRAKFMFLFKNRFLVRFAGDRMLLSLHGCGTFAPPVFIVTRNSAGLVALPVF
jgi:hypothetical protein